MKNIDNASTTNLTKSELGFNVSGQLVFETVSAIVEKGRSYIQKNTENEIVIDCQQLSRIDSAGIATLLDWQRESELAKKKCRFDKLPKQAHSLLKAYRL